GALPPGPSLRSGPGLTFLTWLNASSPGTEPSLRVGSALDTLDRGQTLQVRARFLVRALLCVPTLTSFGFALTHWTGARRWTLTSFGFALTLPTDVGCFKFSARPFVRAHPHFVQVRAQHSGCRFMLDHHFVQVRAQRSGRRFMLPVRARSFVSAQSGHDFFVSAQFAAGTLTA